MLEVGHAIAAFVDDFPVLKDRNRAARRVRLGPGRENGVDVRPEPNPRALAAGGRLLRQEDGDEDQDERNDPEDAGGTPARAADGAPAFVVEIKGIGGSLADHRSLAE